MHRRVNGITRGTDQGRGQEPEFCQPGGIEPMFGIGRSKLYELADRGEIELIHCRQPGQKRGLCLVRVASVRDYIERCRCTSSAAAEQTALTN